MKLRNTGIMPHSLDAIFAEDDDLGLLVNVTPLKPKEVKEEQSIANFKSLLLTIQINIALTVPV